MKTGTMSSSSTSPQWKHYVFVSFIEDGMVKTFISNLFKRLNQVGINYFEDDNSEGAGEENKDKRLNAICQQTFAFALVVFSKNYVNSDPCLNKLVEILNCNSDPEVVVIPIFYIDRAKVSDAASNKKFKQALRKVKEEKKWRNALANGLSSGSSERNLIDKIVGRLVNKIHSPDSGNEFTFGPFGSKGRNDWNLVNIENIDGRGIAVEYGDFIKSITFKVPEAPCTKPYVEMGENDTYKVKLEDGEYITSFAGSKNANNKGIICSLTFRTNKRILGPIGRVKEETKEEEKRKKKQEEEERKEEEEYFSVPSDAGEVIEFFWRKEDNFLESVGARVRLHPKEFCPFRSVVGLFGKEMGTKWDDEPTHANVRKIIVCLDQKQNNEVYSSAKRFIRSIEFTYVEEDRSLGKPKRHVSKRGGDVNSIVLRANEYLTSISGYYDDEHAGLTSLTFRTNIRMAILIGEEKGIYFSSPAMAGKIVGFYGYIDEHLCGIGAYFELISDLERFGGKYSWDNGKFDGVREIRPFVKDDGTQYIHGIKFVYDDDGVEGHATHGNCIERKGVFPGNEPVKLDYPREYLTSISGYMQENGSISSLTFYSNKRRFVNGTEGGTYFWYPLSGSRIIGFYGTWDKTLNFIGVYVEPIPHLYPFKTVGRPIEGSGGTPWDDGVHTNVRGFRVTTTTIGPDESKIIESITFMYDDKGSLVEGSRHGGGDESSGKWVMLDFPEERLTRIEGYMRVDGDPGQTIIHDLRIVTTKRERTPVPYAPRGSDKNPQRRFEIPEKSKGGRIVGFFGMAGTHLNSIGARLEPYLIVGVLKKKALIHGKRLKKNGDKKLQAFDDEELPKHEGKECQQRSLKSSPRIATLVYCIGFVCVLLLTWWTFWFFLI